MKITKTLIVALALCLSLVSVAEAKGRSGSTFKGGFSSQRQKAPTPAPSYQVPASSYQAPAQATKPSFGSFGGNKATTQAATKQTDTNYQPSQMSRDMSTTNAQANAQKTWDARNKPQAPDSQTASKSDSGWFRSGNQTGPAAAQTPPPNYSQAGQYRNERHGDSGGGFWNGVMWFMLGHSLANSSHANTTVVTVPATTTQAASGNMDLGPGENTQAASAPMNESHATKVPEPQPESALVSLLRAVLWTLVVVAGFWILRGFMRMRNRANSRRSNYSLGK